jgi:hypothetical protein
MTGRFKGQMGSDGDVSIVLVKYEIHAIKLGDDWFAASSATYYSNHCLWWVFGCAQAIVSQPSPSGLPTLISP